MLSRPRLDAPIEGHKEEAKPLFLLCRLPGSETPEYLENIPG